MAGTVSSLVVKIGADISELQSAMGKVQKSVQDTGKRMTDLGKTISTRVTAPLTALGAVAVRAFGVQEKAELQLRAALQANGREVDRLFKSYNDFAQEMQRTTVVGDETTLAMLAQAESLGLTADSAERAVKNSIAMQSAFGVNAQSALRYTAALEQGNATMLTRYIPTLRDIEDESERAAEAQRILGNAFSSAEAEAQGSTGQMIQMKNAVGDLLEVVGKVIAEAILPFVRRIKEMAEAAQNLNPSVIRMGVVIAGVAAAIGPLLVIGGQFLVWTSKAIGMIGRFVRVLGLVLSPIFLKIAAIAALVLIVKSIYDTFTPIQEFFQSLWQNVLNIFEWAVNNIIRAWNSVRSFMAKIVPGISEGVVETFTLMNEAVGGKLSEFGANVKQNFNDALGFVQDFARGAISGITGFIFKQDELAKSTEKAMGRVAFSYESASDRARAAILRMNFGVVKGVERTKTNLTEFADITDELAARINTAILDMTQSFFEGLSNMAAAGGGFKNVANNLLTTLADLAVQMGRIILASGIGIEALKKSLQAFSGIGAIAAGAALIALGSAAKSALSSAGRSAGGGAVSQNFQPSARDVPGQTGGNVTFEIEYDKLVGVLDNGGRRRGRIG